MIGCGSRAFSKFFIFSRNFGKLLFMIGSFIRFLSGLVSNFCYLANCFAEAILLMILVDNGLKRIFCSFNSGCHAGDSGISGIISIFVEDLLNGVLGIWMSKQSLLTGPRSLRDSSIDLFKACIF